MDIAPLPTPPGRVTKAAFLAWPDDEFGRRQQLVDGEVLTMSPTSQTHGIMHGRIGFLLALHVQSLHVQSARPECRVLVAPGVPPRLLPEWNVRSPDLAVVCRPASAEHLVPDPVLIVEILSPSNQRQTRANVWAFTTIPSVQEILLVSSLDIVAELLRRGPDGSWPDRPEIVGADETLRLDSIGGTFALREFYATTALAAPAS